MKTAIKIIITDNVKRFRETLISIIEPYGYFECIGEADNGKELLDLLKRLKPDVVLLDLEMPVMDGSKAMDEISLHFPGTKVIVITGHYEEILVDDFITRGAKGFLPKDEIMGNWELLVTAINEVYKGNIFVHHLPIERRVRPIKFTPKEKIIVPLMCQDFTNEDIAQTMGTNKRTVERLRQRIYIKVGGSKAVDFFKYAFTNGLHYVSKKFKKTEGKDSNVH